MSKEKIIILDTTLRDGEQSPGASMTVDEKIRIAHQLERLQVDVIEAGFPISSDGDFLAVQRIAQTIKHCSIAGLARAKFTDIDKAWEALKKAASPRIHTFISTSPIHMRAKLQMTPEAVLEAAIASVKHACKYTQNVEWSAEDAGRSDMEFLCRIVEEAIKAGAATINIPDTVGYCMPNEFGNKIRELFERVPNIHKAVLSVHCHNDLGLSVANSLTAITNGARQIECTVNGLGERAGNAALEEVVMAIRTRSDIYPFTTSIKTNEITRTSSLVSIITGIKVQPNKAIVGANAFAHESGIHQDGHLKDKATYEIMTPESIGLSSSEIMLGKLSGRHAFKDRLETLGYSLNDHDLNLAFTRFKELADKRKHMTDDDIVGLVDDEIVQRSNRLVLKGMTTSSNFDGLSSTAIEVVLDDKVSRASAFGEGSVESIFKAIISIFPTLNETFLTFYEVESITGGENAQASVNVKLKIENCEVHGRSTDADVLKASAKAYINAINKLLFIIERKKHTQT